MDCNSANNHDAPLSQQAIFVNTHLIHQAMEGLQKSRGEFQTLLEQAESGDRSVYYDLGVRFIQGDGTEKDPAQGAHWFSLAAEEGDLRAIGALGHCYRTGDGVAQDMQLAVELFRSAAEQGSAAALCDLGL
ncbi:MAG TPA: hypothetical protein DIT49_06340, partial [Clostridiales bacterium]|nr:hypothetical protein [Clostridiales bacterium]